MRLTYDPKHNIAYLKLRDKTDSVETIRVSDEIDIDIAADDTVYGIELLDANTQLKASDNGRFVLVDPTGKEQVLPLAGRGASSEANPRPAHIHRGEILADERAVERFANRHAAGLVTRPLVDAAGPRFRGSANRECVN